MGVVTLSVGWLLPGILGQMKKSLLGMKINVLPLCFPLGSLRAMILCYFFKCTTVIYRNISTVAFHNRRLYLGGTLGIASVSKLLRSCDNVEVVKVGSELSLDSSSASWSFMTLGDLCKPHEPQFLHQ